MKKKCTCKKELKLTIDLVEKMFNLIQELQKQNFNDKLDALNTDNKGVDKYNVSESKNILLVFYNLFNIYFLATLYRNILNNKK